jgi:hypothetical protein
MQEANPTAFFKETSIKKAAGYFAAALVMKRVC